MKCAGIRRRACDVTAEVSAILDRSKIGTGGPPSTGTTPACASAQVEHAWSTEPERSAWKWVAAMNPTRNIRTTQRTMPERYTPPLVSGRKPVFIGAKRSFVF